MTEKQKLKNYVTKNWHPKTIEAIITDDETLFKHCRQHIQEARKMYEKLRKKLEEIDNIMG
jgi:hypothetical protein